MSGSQTSDSPEILFCFCFQIAHLCHITSVFEMPQHKLVHWSHPQNVSAEIARGKNMLEMPKLELFDSTELYIILQKYGLIICDIGHLIKTATLICLPLVYVPEVIY